MFILVDKTSLTMLAKYRSLNGLLCLADLELPYTHVCISCCDSPLELDSFSDYELKVMYRKLTGASDFGHIGWNRDALLILVCDTIKSLPELDAIETELSAQADSIDPDYVLIYRYSKGSQVPEMMVDIYNREPLAIARNELLEIEAKQTKLERLDFFEIVNFAEQNPKTIVKREPFDFSKVVPLPIKQPWL